MTNDAMLYFATFHVFNQSFFKCIYDTKTYGIIGKSIIGSQPTGPTQPFILSGLISE